MQAVRRAAAALLAAVIVAPSSAFADGLRAPDTAMLAAVVQEHAALQEADRQTIRQALGRPEVRDVAGRVGVDVDRITGSIDTIAVGDLGRAADAARKVNKQLDRQLAGGESTVAFSTTTIIITLLVAIVVVVAIR